MAVAAPELAGRLRHRRELAGATPGALEAWLALRGGRTLAVPVEQGSRNGGELADAASADAVCGAVRVISAATIVGGVESTIERRAEPGQEHVPSGLLRLSVGCEHVEDLWDDVAAALRSGPVGALGSATSPGDAGRGSSRGRVARTCAAGAGSSARHGTVQDASTLPASRGGRSSWARPPEDVLQGEAPSAAARC